MEQQAKQALSADKLYSKWLRLLQLTFVSDEDEGVVDVSKGDYKIIVNILTIAWFLFLIWKQLLSTMLTDLPDFMVGNTITRTGNTAQLIMWIAACAFAINACYRLACIRMLMHGHMIVVRTLKQVTGGSSDAVRGRDKKLAIALKVR